MKKGILYVFSEARTSLVRAFYYLRGLFGLPGMSNKEIEIFKTILKSLKGKKIRVFEWGCGGSTIYFAKFLLSKGIDFQWHGIDNSAKWHQRVVERVEKNKLSDKIHLHLFEFTPFWLKPGWRWDVSQPKGFGPQFKNEKEYIAFPHTLGMSFDLIIIDARFRRRCLIEAQKLLAPGGVVVIHDAQKKRYHSSFALYKHQILCDSKNLFLLSFSNPGKIWIGSNEELPENIRKACR